MLKSFTFQKQKTIGGSQIPYYDDPLYKEYESISIDKFKSDKEKAIKEYHQLIMDLETIKDDYHSTKKRAYQREEDLREYVNNLLIKYRTRDPEKNLSNMNSLKDQIMTNIQTLEAQSKEDIREKKKDLETRIKLRLVDSETNYNRDLEKKQKEQEGIIASLQDVTFDMEKIRSNFNSIKAKENNYINENKEYKKRIAQYENDNAELKAEIMRLKHLNNKYAIRVMAKQQNNQLNDNNDNDNEMNNTKTNSLKTKLAIKSRKRLKDKVKGRKPIDDRRDNLISPQGFDSNLTIDKIVELLTNDTYLKKHYRQCSVISSLLNIYDKTNRKIQKITSQYQTDTTKHPVYDKLLSIIQMLKNNEINSKLKYVNSMSKRMINDLLGNYTVIMNKAQRKELIEAIVNDPSILAIITDEKLPNIVNRERYLGH